MAHGLRRLAILILCAMAAAGCRSSAPVASSTDLQPVSLPDLAQVPTSVRDQIGRTETALSHRIAADDASPQQLAAAYGELGLLLFAALFPDHAKPYLENAQRLAPDDPRWPFYLGHLHLSREARPAAARAFERAVELAPRDYAARVWLAETYLDDGRAVEAEAAFLEAVRLAPVMAAAHAGAGRAALVRQAYAAAVGYFTKALELDPAARGIHYPLGRAYRGLGDVEKAETHLRRGGHLWPEVPDPWMDEYRQLVDSARAWESRGRQALNGGDSAAAIQALRRGLDLDPDDAELRHALATALLSAGDRDGAVEELEQTTRRSPAFAKAYATLGRILNMEGRHHEAVDRLRMAVERDPQLIEAQIGLAESLRVTGQFEASLPHYERAVALDPRQPAAWLGALSLMGLGRTGEAREWLTRARRVHPDRQEFADLLEGLPETGR